jgi:uncharacterized protein YkwD
MSFGIRFVEIVANSGWIFVLLTGIFSIGDLAAEINLDNLADNDVFLPLVMQSEKVIPTPIIPPDASYEDQVIIFTNQERMNHGCRPLLKDDRLQLAAEGHSQDMALNDYFNHVAPDGTTPWDRIRSLGYFYSIAGENIAAGYPSPNSVVQGWMNSEGHRANILNCGFKDIGVGYHYLENDTGSVNYQHYWTQVFASP